jgi:uncharacterized protein YmfQ (DUF2313 family)
MSLTQKILNLTRQLYPTGRAFKMPKNSVLERLHSALAISEVQAYEDAVSILNSSLPDNDDYSEEDATAWERRLGLITSEGVSLADRKLAIQRKLNYPGNTKARNNYLWLERNLRAAGFDVYVFENRFPIYPDTYETLRPDEIVAGDYFEDYNHGPFNHGEINHGGTYGNVIANHIKEEDDFGFDIGDNLRSTFFISGTPVGTYANIEEIRKDEFRQLILRLKPVQTVGFLFVNYV